jgi:hypothetical protein
MIQWYQTKQTSLPSTEEFTFYGEKNTHEITMVSVRPAGKKE